MDDSLSKLLQPDLTTLARQVQLPQNTAVLFNRYRKLGSRKAKFFSLKLYCACVRYVVILG